MELVAIILVIAAVAAAEVLIFGKYALKGIMGRGGCLLRGE